MVCRYFSISSQVNHQPQGVTGRLHFIEADDLGKETGQQSLNWKPHLLTTNSVLSLTSFLYLI